MQRVQKVTMKATKLHKIYVESQQIPHGFSPMQFAFKISSIFKLSPLYIGRHSFSKAKSPTKEAKWQPIIGLEIHAQIKSESKLFSDAPYGSLESLPNENVALFDASIPGTLPVLNKVCVDQAIKTGLALNATINKYTSFDRKHYFYPDLPHGYQITQNHHPIVSNGVVKIELKDATKEIRIARIQLETDSGKSFHTAHPQYSLIDLNRAGRGLMEIVTEPDMRSSEEAAIFLKKLQHLLRHIGASEVNMEEGEMRCDVNVSIQKVGEPSLGTRCEVKNMNSIKNIQKAIEYEIKRQIQVLESGGKIDKETRFFNASKGETVVMRSKEDEVDYRFLPEPNLPPLLISEERISSIKATLPELPEETKARIQKQYNISGYESEVILSAGVLAYFERASANRDGKKIAHWVINDLMGMANNRNITVEETMDPNMLGEVIDYQEKGLISGSAAKQTILAILNGDKRTPKQIIEEKGLLQLSDRGELTKLCTQVVNDSAKEVEQFKKGNFRMMQFFVGKVMQLSKGRANPVIVDEIFKELLK